MENIKAQISELNNSSSQKIDEANNATALDELYLQLFSKKHGQVTQLVKQLADLSIEDKKEIGPEINELQSNLKQMIEEVLKIRTYLKIGFLVNEIHHCNQHNQK